MGNLRTKLIIIEGIFTAKKYIELIDDALEDFYINNPDILDFVW